MNHDRPRTVRCLLWLAPCAAAVVLALASCTTTAVHSYSTGADESLRAARTALPLLEGPFDEIWIMAREAGRTAPRPVSSRAVAPAPLPDDSPRIGQLMAQRGDDATDLIALPLQRTEFDGSVDGPIVSATMRQRYVNPFETMIDAVYVFPLPHDSAVSDFVLVVGDRRIRAIIREREEAAHAYAEARRAGHVASLLTEERPNIFIQRVANIEPGHAIDVELTFHGTLGYEDGWHELAIPLVVGPRFTPGDFAPPPELGVVARPRAAPPEGADRHEVRYLAPHETSAHRVAMRWSIDAGTEILDLSSPSHRITVDRDGEQRRIVTVADTDGSADRDFILRWRVGGAVPTAALVSSGDHFALTLYPPTGIDAGERVPIELIVVIDRSGSMAGSALRQAKAIAKTMLGALDSTDSFTIVEFSQTAEVFADQPVAASRENVRAAQRAIDSLRAGGGTHMLRGMRGALSIPGDEARQRHVVLLTDGFIGNEVEVLSAVHAMRDGARVNAIGLGRSVNRFLIGAMAQVGHGTSGVLLPEESASAAAESLLARLRHPIMADLALETSGLEISHVFPESLPDLHAGRPITAIGRSRHIGPASLTLTGWVGSQRVRVPIAIDFAGTADAIALDRLWARTQIADLTRQAWCGEIDDAPARIRTIALRHGILSPFTSFLAVDASRVVDHDRSTIVQQAVPVPADVELDTTVGHSDIPH